MPENLTTRIAEDFLTVDQAAAILKIPRSTLLCWNSKRKLTFFKIGRRCYYKFTDVMAYLESCKRPAVNQK